MISLVVGTFSISVFNFAVALGVGNGGDGLSLLVSSTKVKLTRKTNITLMPLRKRRTTEEEDMEEGRAGGPQAVCTKEEKSSGSAKCAFERAPVLLLYI